MKKNYMKKLTARVLGGLMTTTMASAGRVCGHDLGGKCSYCLG